MRSICAVLLLSVPGMSWAADWKPADAKMLTEWGQNLNPTKVWAEYPRPQLQRDGWTNLNGEWNYAIVAKDEAKPGKWDGQILVPFSPEAALSGVGRQLEPDQDLWYQRKFSIKSSGGHRTLLHFEAVDYLTMVWVNGKKVGSHQGGNLPFTFDITDAVKAGENDLTVQVHDDTEGYQLHGKQSLNPRGIWNQRVSGIWQTVWMEEVATRFIDRLDFTPDIKNGTILIKAALDGKKVSGEKLRIVASLQGKNAGEGQGEETVMLKLNEPQLWTPEHPNLYDLKVELLDGKGKVLDSVKSYSALREISKMRDRSGSIQIALNGEPIFLYGPLDQGWWPDGLLTPPSDEAMLYDLKYLKDAGFNMVRKHVKIEPARYYTYCDRMGIVVWQDQVSCSLGAYTPDKSPKWTRMAPNPVDAVWPEAAHQEWVSEYKQMVDHLREHPSVCIWAPFNEAWGQHATMEIGAMASEYDPSRLVCIASGGNFWPVGDIASDHHYPMPSFSMRDPRYKDFIKVVGEMGGYGLPIEGHVYAPDGARGYGPMSASLDQWKLRYSGVVDQMVALRLQGVSAAVYTQTTDMWNEVNGFLTYDRKPKVDAAWLKQINGKLVRNLPSKGVAGAAH